MKKLILFMFLFAAFQLSSLTAQAAEKSTCKVKTNDIGTITGKGRSPAEAFEDAATQCFDRRASLYKMKKGSEKVDEDSGLVMIDACANVTCS